MRAGTLVVGTLVLAVGLLLTGGTWLAYASCHPSWAGSPGDCRTSVSCPVWEGVLPWVAIGILGWAPSVAARMSPPRVAAIGPRSGEAGP